MKSIQKLDSKANRETASFVERRQLFKNIWETAMNIDEKDDIMNKPKVIKTLRLDEVDKCVVGKTKKQRIKNLRHVCKRIIDFCDKQDADDTLYEQLTTEGLTAPDGNDVLHEMKTPKKTKIHKRKKKVTKAKSMFDPPTEIPQIKTTISERKDDLTRIAGTATSKIASTNKIKISAFVKGSVTKKKMKSKTSAKNSTVIDNAIVETKTSNVPTKLRKTVRRRHIKRKKY